LQRNNRKNTELIPAITPATSGGVGATSGRRRIEVAAGGDILVQLDGGQDGCHPRLDMVAMKVAGRHTDRRSLLKDKSVTDVLTRKGVKFNWGGVGLCSTYPHLAGGALLEDVEIHGVDGRSRHPVLHRLSGGAVEARLHVRLGALQRRQTVHARPG